MYKKYSRSKTSNYEKKIRNILNPHDLVNDSYITNIAFNMSEISSDPHLIDKYIHNNINRIVQNTVIHSVNAITPVRNYKHPNNIDNRLGVCLSTFYENILEKYFDVNIDDDYYYEIKLNKLFDHDNNSNNTRSFCTRLYREPPLT